MVHKKIMTNPAPSNTRLLLDLDDARAERIRQEQALTVANRNANIGALCFLLGVAVFWLTNWYLLALGLVFLGLMMWVGNATRRSTARKAVAEAENAIASLKAQVK